MKREAERLQLAKSGYADSQLADPEVPQGLISKALCAKAARTYDLTRREGMCCASSLKGHGTANRRGARRLAQHRENPCATSIESSASTAARPRLLPRG